MRIRLGKNDFRQWFRESLKQNAKTATQALNSRRLLFPSLFLLLPDIEEHNLYSHLNEQTACACRFCMSRIMKDSKPDLAFLTDRFQERRILRWVFTTGADWDAPDEDTDAYDAVMDAAASRLVTVCKDKTILPAVVNLIFRRNRRNLLVHDLVWCLYKACDPDSLGLVAAYLLSEDSTDRELACKILHLPFDERYDPAAARRQYNDYMAWLNENKDCICFTGESFQLTSNPRPVAVNLEAKYLGKKISPEDGKWLEPLTPAEKEKLDLFRSVPDADREVLAAYSRYLYRRNRRSWNQWMQSRHEDQIRIAAAGLEALHDHYK